jgi:NAD(P)-dependent dehydrogenase (short-subunit alcohol dehydrogenase family)
MAHATGKIVVLTEASKGIGARIARMLGAVVAVVDAIRHCLAADVVRDFHHDFIRGERRLVWSGGKRTSTRNKHLSTQTAASSISAASASDSCLIVGDAGSEGRQ